MIVVADTSPLNYLIQINCDSVLPVLYGKVFVPEAVFAELNSPNAPIAVTQWLLRRPAWLEVNTVHSQPDLVLGSLDPGEREAILLAEEIGADLLLLDERRGRHEACIRGLLTTGTLGVLLAASKKGLIDAESAFKQLINETSFRSSEELKRFFIARVRQ